MLYDCYDCRAVGLLLTLPPPPPPLPPSPPLSILVLILLLLFFLKHSCVYTLTPNIIKVKEV